MTKRTERAQRTQAENGAGPALAHLVEPMLAGMTTTRQHLLAWVHAHGFFATTNCIENLIGTLRHVTRNIKRWRDGDMRRGGSGSVCCAPPSAFGASSGITSSARSSPRSRPRRPQNVPHESSCQRRPGSEGHNRLRIDLPVGGRYVSVSPALQ
jgi:hypothetical protein